VGVMIAVAPLPPAATLVSCSATAMQSWPWALGCSWRPTWCASTWRRSLRSCSRGCARAPGWRRNGRGRGMVAYLIGWLVALAFLVLAIAGRQTL
jgi:hypothetical protein